jgi:hypothetical protein
MPHWKANAGWYQTKYDDHDTLFNKVLDIIEDNQIDRLLEIGGGLCQLADFVQHYTGIELNLRILSRVATDRPQANMILGDWNTLDGRTFAGQFDAVVALAVVEHVAYYDDFILRCLDAEPAHVLISFYRGLRDADDIKQRTNKAAGTHYDNIYSKQGVVDFLENHRDRVASYDLFQLVRQCGETETLLSIQTRRP